MSDSINELLQGKRDQEKKEMDHQATFKKEIKNLRKEMHSHLETIEQNAWDWQRRFEASNNRDDPSMASNEDMSTQSEHDHSQESTSQTAQDTASQYSDISLHNIPYTSMAQFCATPATESNSADAGGHPGQKRPITDVSTGESG